MEYKINIRQTNGKKLYVSLEEGEAIYPSSCQADRTAGKSYACLDENNGIYLYPSEVKKQGLKEGDCLHNEEFEQLRKEYAIPRVRKRAIAILAKKDCTEKELRDKLEQSMNDSISIERAIEYVKVCGYVNDESYVRDYIYFKKEKKSYRQIRMELEKKGIDGEILDRVFEETGEQDAEDLRPLVRKYIKRFQEMDSLAKKKTGAYFYRKGYATDLVRSILDEMDNMNDTDSIDDINDKGW